MGITLNHFRHFHVYPIWKMRNQVPMVQWESGSAFKDHKNCSIEFWIVLMTVLLVGTGLTTSKYLVVLVNARTDTPQYLTAEINDLHDYHPHHFDPWTQWQIWGEIVQLCKTNYFIQVQHAINFLKDDVAANVLILLLNPIPACSIPCPHPVYYYPPCPPALLPTSNPNQTISAHYSIGLPIQPIWRSASLPCVSACHLVTLPVGLEGFLPWNNTSPLRRLSPVLPSSQRHRSGCHWLPVGTLPHQRWGFCSTVAPWRRGPGRCSRRVVFNKAAACKRPISAPRQGPPTALPWLLRAVISPIRNRQPIS